MSDTAAARDRTIVRLERWAKGIRVVAIAWTSWTALTFAYLTLFRPQSIADSESWPIYLGATLLSMIFLGVMSWPAPDVRSWLDRVGIVLNWQVASGAVIAFSIAVTARPELFIAFGSLGLYLLLSAFSAMALSIVAAPLHDRYRARDQAQAAERLREQLDQLTAQVVAAVRPQPGCANWWKSTRHTRRM